MSNRFKRTDGVVTTQVLGRVGDPSLSTHGEVEISILLGWSHICSNTTNTVTSRDFFFSPSIEQDYDPE